MNDCTSCRAEMLEHLYDLLDDTDGRAMQDHLDACPACRAELARARGQQHLLAAAARMEFPGRALRGARRTSQSRRGAAPSGRCRVRLRRPAPGAAGPPPPPSCSPLGGARRPATGMERDYLRAPRRRRRPTTTASACPAEGGDAGERAERPAPSRATRRSRRSATPPAPASSTSSSRPQRVEVGAPATYASRPAIDGQPVTASLDVRVVDEGRPASRPAEERQAATASIPLTLRPTCRCKPNSRLALEVTARREGDDDADSSLREHVELAAPVYVTHLATDRPMYQVGDVVHFRSLTLERFSLKPPPDDFRLVYTITRPARQDRHPQAAASALAGRRAAAAAELTGPDGKPLRGLGSGDYFLERAWRAASTR